MFTPVAESHAKGVVHSSYEEIKAILGVRSVPLFFTYIGAFPDYLDYIVKQLSSNLRDSSFLRISSNAGSEIDSLIAEELPMEKVIADWKNRYWDVAAQHNFEKELASIHKTNIALAFVFVALREAVKGWAIAAKKLNSESTSTYGDKQAEKMGADDFIYEQVAKPKNGNHLAISGSALSRNKGSAIEKNLLPEYMNLCRMGFQKSMQSVEFWQLRVAVEKIVLAVLPLLPHVVFSPVNVVIELTKKHENFPELLYLLSEHFPTYAVQRMIFSGYMKRK